MDKPASLPGLPAPASVRSGRWTEPSPALVLPGPAEQAERLAGAFATLAAAAQAPQAGTADAPPTVGLVMITAGAVSQLRGLAAATQGLEWAGEWPEMLSPEDTLYDAQDAEAPFEGFGYYLLATPAAVYALRARWQRYLAGRLYASEAKWQAVFDRLHTLHPYRAQHRLAHTGFWQAWSAASDRGEPTFYCELELWYRASQVYRTLAQAAVAEAVRQAGGQLVGEACVMPALQYHAVVAALPTAELREGREQPERLGLFNCAYLRTLRPTGSLQATAPKDQPLPYSAESHGAAGEPPPGLPQVGLLGGLPMQSHPLLRGQLRVHDPEDLSRRYPMAYRQQGTQLASLCLYGDRNTNDEPLDQPLYVQPILQPAPDSWTAHERSEQSPPQELPVRLVDRAVRRMMTRPEAAQISLVVLAVNDAYAAFAQAPHPLARLLDQLSYEFGLLFMLSAGNAPQPLRLGLRLEELYALQGTRGALQQQTLRALYRARRERRLLAPGEALNGLTIGASHEDAAPPDTPHAHRHDLLQATPLGSPLSRTGPGYRAAMKPDVLLPGGRQLFTDQFYLAEEEVSLVPASTRSGQIRPPGLLAAAPSEAGQAAMTYTTGADRATALAARVGARLQAYLPGELGRQARAVATKALLVHDGQRQAETAHVREQMASGADEAAPTAELPAWLNAYMGFGRTNEARLLKRLQQGALAMYTGTLTPGGGDAFTLPLPKACFTPNLQVRLQVTLAWFAPIEPRGGAYQRAQLWFALPRQNPLNLAVAQPDRRPLRRSTIWHETYSGQPSPEAAGQPLRCSVNSRLTHRQDAGAGPLPYALILSLASEPELPLREGWIAALQGVASS